MNQVDFERSLAAWVEERRASGQHSTVETLDAYRAGRLGPQQREGVREHLVLCRQCFDLLQDLEVFASARRSASRPPAEVADFETAAFWHALRPRLETVAEEPSASRRRPKEPAVWRLPAAVAASVLVTALGFSFWIADRERALATSERQLAELQVPRPNTRIYDLYLDTSERSGESRPQPVEVPPGSMLILTPQSSQDPGEHSGYAVEILDSAGARAWTGRGFRADPEDGTFTLWLPPDFLPPGEYRVRLLGGDADPSELIEEYVVRMAR